MNSDFDSDAWQELRQAIRNDDLEKVVSVVSRKPELLCLNPTLGSCLHLAASKGRLNIVKKLVELGADVNLYAEVGGSPLDEAASEGHLAVVKYLIEHGASLAVPRPDRNP